MYELNETELAEAVTLRFATRMDVPVENVTLGDIMYANGYRFPITFNITPPRTQKHAVTEAEHWQQATLEQKRAVDEELHMRALRQLPAA